MFYLPMVISFVHHRWRLYCLFRLMPVDVFFYVLSVSQCKCSRYSDQNQQSAGFSRWFAKLVILCFGTIQLLYCCRVDS